VLKYFFEAKPCHSHKQHSHFPLKCRYCVNGITAAIGAIIETALRRG